VLKTVPKLKRCPPPWSPDGTSASRRDLASAGGDDRGNWRIPRVKALQQKSLGFGSLGGPVELNMDPLSTGKTEAREWRPKSPWLLQSPGAGVRPDRTSAGEMGRIRLLAPWRPPPGGPVPVRCQRFPVPVQRFPCFCDLVPCSFQSLVEPAYLKEQQNSAFPPLGIGFSRQESLGFPVNFPVSREFCP